MLAGSGGCRLGGGKDGGVYLNRPRLFMTWLPTRVLLPKALQSTTVIVSGGWRYSFSGSSWIDEQETMFRQVGQIHFWISQNANQFDQSNWISCVCVFSMCSMSLHQTCGQTHQVGSEGPDQPVIVIVITATNMANGTCLCCLLQIHSELWLDIGPHLSGYELIYL